MDIDAITFEGFYERFGHAVGLRASNRSEARNQAQADRELDRFVSSVTAAVVGEPLDRLRRDRGAKASVTAFRCRRLAQGTVDKFAARAYKKGFQFHADLAVRQLLAEKSARPLYGDIYRPGYN